MSRGDDWVTGRQDDEKTGVTGRRYDEKTGRWDDWED